MERLLMFAPKFAVAPGVSVERVGDDIIVATSNRLEVFRLSGKAADLFLDVQAGRTPPPSENLLSELESRGILESSGLSRRGLIRAGAIGAGAGIALMTMPSVAAASSLLVLQMGEYGRTSGVANGTTKVMILGGANLRTYIPNGSVGVLKVLDQEFTVTDGAATPYGSFSDYPYFFNVVQVSGIRDHVVFTRDILDTDLLGQTITITFETLNIRIEYTVAT